MKQIDKNIPVPATGRAKYPWHDMNIGDSFLHDNKANAGILPPRSLHDKGWKFRTKITDEGLRVWRVK